MYKNEVHNINNLNNSIEIRRINSFLKVMSRQVTYVLPIT